jgi:citronellyl-CoA dehydrogenase
LFTREAPAIDLKVNLSRGASMINPFTEEHEAFRKTVRAWVEKEMTPHALEWDRAGIFPRELFKKAGELGFLGINHDPKYGGSGLDYWFVTAFAEELSRSQNAGVNMALLVQSQMATPIINELGTDEQKREFLEPALKGEKIAALGVSEPGAGSDVANMKTTARIDGDDYVINGSKMWITNGTRADFITLGVRTGEEGYGGISLVTFPTDVKGFSVSKKLDKVGNLSSDTAILYFEDCRIPRRYVLGQENEGFYSIMTNFQGERLVGAITTVAGMERMVEDSIRYGNEREAFGKPLIKFQVWRHKFVEHLTAIEAAKRLTYHAVALFDAKENPVKEISMAKLFAGDLAQKVAYDCQQFFGGMGYIEETPVARAWRDIRLITIGGGTSEIMKEIISKLYGF